MNRVPTTEEIRAVDDTRLRLVFAGARILADSAFETLAAGLSPERVARLAGRNRRVFYDYFESKEDFLRAITALFFDPSAPTLVTQLSPEQLGEELRWSEGDLFDSVDKISKLTFGQDLLSDAGELQLLAWAVGHDDHQIREQLAGKLNAVNSAIAHVLESLLDYWGMELRAPWTFETFAAVIRGLSDGLYIRSRVHPELAGTDLFVLAVLTMCGNAAVPGGNETVSVRESVQRLGDEAASLWRTEIDDDLAENAYERVVDAFRQELQQRGLGQTTINSVARRSQLSPAFIGDAFPSTHDILKAAVSDSLPTLMEEAEFDLTTKSISTREATRRHVVRLSTWIVENPDLARALLTLSIADPTDEAGTELASELISQIAQPAALILEDGVTRGDVRDDVELLEIAILTTELMLGRVRTEGQLSLDSTSDFITSLIFGGAGVHS